jgi:hypothetical protein
VITGALILLVGLVVGYLVGVTRKPRPPKALPPPEPICGCHHHLALHDLAKKTCTGWTKHVTLYENGIERKWEFYPCKCKHYVGPEYLPQYVAPELASE